MSPIELKGTAKKATFPTLYCVLVADLTKCNLYHFREGLD